MTPKVLGIFFIVFCYFAVIYGKKKHTHRHAGKHAEVPMACLGCICDAASECNTTIGCEGDICGPFRITASYWTDGGKPSLNNETDPDDSAFEECVNDAFCAARAVKGYMKKYSQDCNRDGRIDCVDYARIHKLGGFGCTAELDEKFEKDFSTCWDVFKQIPSLPSESGTDDKETVRISLIQDY